MTIWTDPPLDQLVNNKGNFSIAFIGEEGGREGADILTRNNELDARNLALDITNEGCETHVFDPEGRRLS